MSNRKTTCVLFTILVFAAGCATTDFPGWPGPRTERRAESLARQGRFEDAASVYIGLAGKAQGTEAHRLTLLAVEQWLNAGDARRARIALRDVPAPASGELLWLWSANAAALALWDGQPDRALSLLEPMSQLALPTAYRAWMEALRADAWFQKRDPSYAVRLLTQREAWLDGEESILRNRKRIWNGLLASDLETLRSATEIEIDPEIQAWLTLGVLAASTGQQGVGWTNGVTRWQEDHYDHPAIAILSDLALPDGDLLDFPRQIALLLPLSGSNASAGRAVQNGFFGAYFSAVAGLQDSQRIRVYDVNETGGARQAYTSAVGDGAEFVVGPLLRQNVDDLAEEILLPVPVLTLNFLPEDYRAPPGLYQFALAPEDEAASAARRAIADDNKRAVALVPNNDWGQRVLTSFATELESMGGKLLDYRRYQPSDQDFSIEIEGLMALSQSVNRYRTLRENIGGPLQFDPRRREDTDFVFLAANASVGRLVKSQLKFHYSGDLPVYSTSFIYSMDGRSNADLNGLMFADTPWIISPHAWIADLPELYARFWPTERRLGRLHAMGFDAYHLVARLFGSRTGPMDEIDGATGRLYLDDEGRVHRRLAWAQFQEGEPVALPRISEFETVLRELRDEPPSEPEQEWQEPIPDL
ncbi:MAG: penicillin-binding protein activator [Woeseia sp.]